MLQNVTFGSSPPDLEIATTPLLNQERDFNNGDNFETIFDTKKNIEQNPFAFQPSQASQMMQQLFQPQQISDFLQPEAVANDFSMFLSENSNKFVVPQSDDLGLNIPEQTPFVFSQTLMPFASHGLDQSLLTGLEAGVSDGKEIINLANKFITHFELKPKVVHKEFEQLALLNSQELSEFNLGEMFNRIGIKPNQLDNAYKMVQELVQRELLKIELKNGLNLQTENHSFLSSLEATPNKHDVNLGNNKYEELLLASKFAEKNQNQFLASKMPTSIDSIDAEMESSYEDFVFDHNKSSPMINMNQNANNSNFSTTPVNLVEINDVSDFKFVNDAIVQDAKILVKDGGGKMDITLNPANMGKVHLIVDTNGKTVNIELVCSNPNVKQVLESQMPELKLTLASAGLLADKIQISSTNNAFSGGFHDNKEDSYAHQEQQKQERSDFDLWDNKNKKQKQQQG